MCGMKSQLLYFASAVALLAWLVCIALLMEHFDVKPHSWGPQGVEFEEWYKVWRARRDLYAWVGVCSFFSGVGLERLALEFTKGRRSECRS